MRQGDATTVRDFRRHAGLDLLPRLLLRGGELDTAVVRSILEAQLHNGPKVAELAALRPPELIERLEASIRDLEADADPVGQQRHALAFWDHVVDGADSIVFRLMFNTLRAAYEPALPALAIMMAAEVGAASPTAPWPARSRLPTLSRRRPRHVNCSNPQPKR